MENESRENKKEEQKMEHSVLGAIKSGKLKMRPRWQFVLQGVLLGIGTAIVFLVLIYLMSFIFFALRETGVLFVPAFGIPGWFALLRELPWVLVILVAFFVVFLEILVRRYAFGYRRPLLYSALTIVAIVLIGGIAVGASSFHDRLLYSSSHGGLPILGGMYQGFGVPHPGDDVHRGEVMEVGAGTFVMQGMRGDTSTVIITPGTRLPFGDGFAVGDTVIVFGDRGTDGSITAFGIQKIED